MYSIPETQIVFPEIVTSSCIYKHHCHNLKIVLITFTTKFSKKLKRSYRVINNNVTDDKQQFMRFIPIKNKDVRKGATET